MGKVIDFIKTDLYRVTEQISVSNFFRCYIFSPGFKFLVWYRIAHHSRRKGILFYFIPKFILLHYSYKFGFDIPAETFIGKGLKLVHFGGVVISPKAKIGENCTFMHDTTIGISHGRQKKGYPSIGNGVFVGAGAKVIGNVNVGDNVVIGANSVVVKDVPNNVVVAGVPATIISYREV